MNLAQLLIRSARLLPEAPAIALGKHAVVSYGELAGRVARLAAGLRQKLDLRQGERVGVAAKNCPEYYELLFACWHAGIVAGAMKAKLAPREFAYILENSGATTCFVCSDLVAAIPHEMPLDERE